MKSKYLYNIFNMALVLGISFFLMGSALPLQANQSKYEGKKVYRVIFKGLENADSAELRSLMETEPGTRLKAAVIREDIKKVFKKGKLKNLKVEIKEYKDGVQLQFICSERPRVKSVEFKGTKEVYDTDLKDLIILKENDVYRTDFVEKSITQIKKKYAEEGYFNVVIRHTIKYIGFHKNKVKVTFVIDEGEEIRVRKIAIYGVKHVNPREIKAYMETKEKFFVDDGTFDQQKFEMDKVKILNFLRQKGYLKAEILSATVAYEWVDPVKKKDRGIFITIRVKEGERFYFDKYTLNIVATEKKPVLEKEKLMKKMELEKTGEVFNNTKFMKDRNSLSFAYATKGYIFARVIPKRTVEEREVVIKGKKERRKFVRIDFTLIEGTKAYVENIIIKGNKKTKDRVIRREVLLKEGAIFDAQKMQLTRENIYNLGYFKQVNVDVRPGSKQGFMNLIIDVVEQPSGSISLGGGYGTTSGFSVFADVSERNLLGMGLTVGGKVEYGPDTKALTLQFAEPWLFNVPLAVKLSVYYSDKEIGITSIFPNASETATYRKELVGYSLGMSYKFLHKWFTVGATWAHTFVTYKQASGNSPDSIFKLANLGLQEKRSLGAYLYFDNRDNYLTPTNGIRTGITVTSVGGWLGGGDHYMKYKPEIYAYFSFFHLPLLKTHPVVFEIRASGSFYQAPLGTTSQDYSTNEYLDIDDRLTIGGPETLRGWNYYDADFPTSWRTVGLFHRILFGFEMRIPIEPRMLWLALFFDGGSIWSDPYWEKHIAAYSETLYGYITEDKASGELATIQEFASVNLLSYFKYSYGFGFRIQIPMLPLRFWFGQKLIYNGSTFVNVANGFNFQFQIGDYRF